eukprot:4007157-Amphidinium_carterae.1
MDNFVGTDPTPAEVEANRQSVGLDLPQVRAFLDDVEVISLGNYCAISVSIALLGLRRHAGPFDWVRSSNDGILQLLDGSFADFYCYKTKSHGPYGVMYTETTWGGIQLSTAHACI